MALPATDSFTGSNDDQLTTYSGNWTLNSGDFDIQSNSLAPDASTASGIHGAHWNADAFSDNQYAEANVEQVAGSLNINLGVGVRFHASSDNFYSFHAAYRDPSTDRTYLYRVVAGTYTQLGSTAEYNFADNDVLRIEASGTTITPLKNGSQSETPGAQTDSSHSSGYAGVTGWDDEAAVIRLYSWEGGNLGGSDPTPSVSDNLTVSDSSSLAVSDPSFSVSDNLTITDDSTVSIQEAEAENTLFVNISRSANYIQVVTP